MKKYFIKTFIFIIILFSVNSIVFASDAYKLDINGSDVSNDYIMAPGRMLAGFEALGHLTNIKWQYTKNSEPIIITRTDNSDKISIKIGDSFLYKNGVQFKFDAPVTRYKDRVYVPLRAIAEAVGAKLFLLNGTVFVRSMDSVVLNDAENKDLSTARTAVIKLKRNPFVTLPLLAPDNSESMYFEYHFPEGESNRFFEYNSYYQQLIFYEVKDGIAWAEWVGQIDLKMNGQSDDNDMITKLDGPISKEVGKRPVINKRIYFFMLNPMSSQYIYGYNDPDGTHTVLEDTSTRELIGIDATTMFITKVPNE